MGEEGDDLSKRRETLVVQKRIVVVVDENLKEFFRMNQRKKLRHAWLNRYGHVVCSIYLSCARVGACCRKRDETGFVALNNLHVCEKKHTAILRTLDLVVTDVSI